MLAIFITTDGQVSQVENDEFVLDGKNQPPNPASDPAGRLYELESMTPVVDPVDGEPKILAMYREIEVKDQMNALRRIPVEQPPPDQVDQA